MRCKTLLTCKFTQKFFPKQIFFDVFVWGNKPFAACLVLKGKLINQLVFKHFTIQIVRFGVFEEVKFVANIRLKMA